ncbi:hypothetical protein [Metabacillus endolithicus]|uniref:hypothetical protein n=1 Tax=Metabacillus endolithicus TaxID=1535204 RepID=UPI0031EAF249
MRHTIFRHFLLILLRNYIFGSLLAVFGVGALFMFTTIDVQLNETILLGKIICLSLLCMLSLESIVFSLMIRPIKRTFLNDQPSLHDLRLSYKQTHRLPILSVYRIFGPHLFGFSIPAMAMSYIYINNEMLPFPLYYVGIAFGASVLIAGMHAIIEFFLATKAIQPILVYIRDQSQNLYDVDFSHQSHIYISIQKKVLYSAIFIGIFPLLLFSLATHFRFTEASIPLLTEYWSWACYRFSCFDIICFLWCVFIVS